MKVLLVGNFPPDRQFSMLSFGDCLMRELPHHGIAPRRIYPLPVTSRPLMPRKLKKWTAYFDKYVVFRQRLKRESKAADIVHILDQGNAIYVATVASAPHVVTCHDLLAVRAAFGEIPGWKMTSTGRKYQDLIVSGLRDARFVAAVSEATASDFRRLILRDGQTLRLIYNGLYRELNHGASQDLAVQVRKAGVRRPFLLHVGEDNPYKNRAGVLEIWKVLLEKLGSQCPDLVVAGRPSTHRVTVDVKESGGPQIVYFDFPSSDLLDGLYERAEGLLFPSLYEGFGLPILEAQSLGCPVFTSDRKPMTEVGGDAAVYFDPTDPREAACAVIGGLARKEELRAQGLQNCDRLSTHRMVSEYAGLYAEVLGGRLDKET